MMQNAGYIHTGGSQSGQGMLEYILIVVLVVVAAVGAWRYFGRETGQMVDTANEQLQSVGKDTKTLENINRNYDPARAKQQRSTLGR